MRLRALSEYRGWPLIIWSAGACSRFRIGHDPHRAKRRQAAALHKVTGSISDGTPYHYKKKSRNPKEFFAAKEHKERKENNL